MQHTLFLTGPHQVRRLEILRKIQFVDSRSILLTGWTKQYLVRHISAQTGQTYVFNSFTRFQVPGLIPFDSSRKCMLFWGFMRPELRCCIGPLIHFGRFFRQPFGENTFPKDKSNRKPYHDIEFPILKTCFSGEPFVNLQNTKVLLNHFHQPYGGVRLIIAVLWLGVHVVKTVTCRGLKYASNM